MTNVAISPAQDTVQAEVFISAPRERVFQAMTDPRQLAQWWGQTGMYRITDCQADLRVGGMWRSAGVGSDGKPFHVEGKYREIEPPRLLVYTWRPSYSDLPETLVRLELDSEAKGTRVRLLHSGFAGVPDAARNHANGWIRVLGWMQGFVERGETVATRPVPSD
jgi:uncharacterized protein YndB with AHSA1/START domain